MGRQEKGLVGRVSFLNGDTEDYDDAAEFIECVRRELPDHPITGFRYEVLTDDPTTRKAVDDILYDLFGEENPRPLVDYQKTPAQGMKMGGM